MKREEERRGRIIALARQKAAESNVVVAKTLLVFAAIGFAVFFLFELTSLSAAQLFIHMTLFVMPVTFVVSALLCLWRNGKGRAFQYVFLVQLALFWWLLNVMSGSKSGLLLPVLIILSLRYYSRKYTVFTFIVSLTVLLGSVVANAYLFKATGFVDLNTVSFADAPTLTLVGFMHDEVIAAGLDSAVLLKNGLILSFFPNALFLSVLFALSLRFMRRNMEVILKNEELAVREADAKADLAEMKTKMVLSQVKPHFVYNALTSIATLCTRDPKKAKELTLDFSDYLRNNLDTLDSDNVPLCPFEEELDHIRTYLAIETVRFGDRLHVAYDVSSTDFYVPALSVQALVENAVKHGLCNKKEGGTVFISAAKTEDGAVVTVRDDGVGFDKDRVQDDGKVHVGLQNIQKRVALYGGTVTVDSTPGEGTTVTVHLKETEEPV